MSDEFRRPARRLAGVLACAFLAGAVYAWGAAAAAHEPPANESRQGTLGDPSALSGATQRSLDENETVFVQLGSQKGPSPRVSVDQAVRSASQAFGFIRDEEPAEAAYGRLTVNNYGKELEADPSRPSMIDPIIENRTVWLVVFRGVQLPLFGPHVSPEYDAHRPGSYSGNIWVAVDAETAEVIGAESVDY